MGNYIDKGVEIVEDFTNFCGDTRVVVALCETAEDTLGVLGEIGCAVVNTRPNKEKTEDPVLFTETEDGEFIVISTANTNANDDLRRIDSNDESYYSL